MYDSVLFIHPVVESKIALVASIRALYLSTCSETENVRFCFNKNNEQMHVHGSEPRARG